MRSTKKENAVPTGWVDSWGLASSDGHGGLLSPEMSWCNLVKGVEESDPGRGNRMCTGL